MEQRVGYQPFNLESILTTLQRKQNLVLVRLLQLKPSSKEAQANAVHRWYNLGPGLVCRCANGWPKGKLPTRPKPPGKTPTKQEIDVFLGAADLAITTTLPDDSLATRLIFEYGLRDHDLEHFRKVINYEYERMKPGLLPEGFRRRVPNFGQTLLGRILYELDRTNNRYM